MRPSIDDSALAGVELTLVDSLDELDALRRWLGERRPVLAIDTETSGLSIARDRLRLVQFGDANRGWAVPWDDWAGAIREIVDRYEGPLVAQHAKFDAGFLSLAGVPLDWTRTHDTMLMAFLANSVGPKSLKGAAALYVDPLARSGEQGLKRAMARNRWTWGTIPVTFPIYWGYAALDTVLTARLAEHLWPLVQPYRAAYDLELACERVLSDVELRGIRIDVEYCEQERSRLTEELAALLERGRYWFGDLNPNAPAQVARALVADGVKLTERTESGQLSVTDDVLRAVDHPLARFVLQARWAQKLLGTYYENFLAFRSGDVLHPHVNQLAAKTGRMSVTEPALQTIPRGANVRDAFVPREGCSMILVDYDNEELRVAAHFSGDEGMLSAFREGRDLHGETAEQIFGPGWTREQRGIAKTGRFAKLYGAGVAKFARSVGLPEVEAAAIFTGLDRASPGLARSMADVVRKVRERDDGNGYGWIAAADGRRLRVPIGKAYVGFNYLIQGSCAVVLKRALVDLDAAGLGEFVLLPVHDEIVFEVPTERVAEALPEIARVMTQDDWRVPLTVSSSVVSRWGDKYREEDPTPELEEDPT